MARCSVRNVSCDYTFYGRLASLIPEMGGVVLDTQFTDCVQIRFKLPVSLVDAFEAKLFDQSFGKLHSAQEQEIFSAVD